MSTTLHTLAERERDIVRLHRLVDDFALEMKARLQQKAHEGRGGWNRLDWDIGAAILDAARDIFLKVDNSTRGDREHRKMEHASMLRRCVDVANYAAFLWYRLNADRLNYAPTEDAPPSSAPTPTPTQTELEPGEPIVGVLEQTTSLIKGASVRVMRSYDYCHFEISLSCDTVAGLDGVNDLRQQAAVLVDEAVRQYKIAKRKEGQRDANEYQQRQLLDRLERIKKKPESELTPEDAALLRSAADREFWASYEEDDYYYDDPDREYHFSMLHKFKEVRVSAATSDMPPDMDIF